MVFGIQPPQLMIRNGWDWVRRQDRAGLGVESTAGDGCPASAELPTGAIAPAFDGRRAQTLDAKKTRAHRGDVAARRVRTSGRSAPVTPLGGNARHWTGANVTT